MRYPWPAPPTHGAEGPPRETAYSQALRKAARSNLLQTTEDTYSRPSMFMGFVGPQPLTGFYYRPNLAPEYPRGWYGPVNAYLAQGPIPSPLPPWAKGDNPTWGDFLRRPGRRK